MANKIKDNCQEEISILIMEFLLGNHQVWTCLCNFPNNFKRSVIRFLVVSLLEMTIKSVNYFCALMKDAENL